jgi:deoxyribodipyrimidine photo-lyase
MVSFLMKNLDFERRPGARNFLDLLVDGDIAHNSGTWLRVAGTGTDTRPDRTFNPIRQSLRFAGPAPAHPRARSRCGRAS